MDVNWATLHSLIQLTMSNLNKNKKDETETERASKMFEGIKISNRIRESMELSSQSFNNQVFFLENAISNYSQLAKVGKFSKQLINQLKKGWPH